MHKKRGGIGVKRKKAVAKRRFRSYSKDNLVGMGKKKKKKESLDYLIVKKMKLSKKEGKVPSFVKKSSSEIEISQTREVNSLRSSISGPLVGVRKLEKKLSGYNLHELLEWNKMYEGGRKYTGKKKKKNRIPNDSAMLRIINSKAKRNAYKQKKDDVFGRLTDERNYVASASKKFRKGELLTEEGLDKAKKDYIKKYMPNIGEEKKEVF